MDTESFAAAVEAVIPDADPSIAEYMASVAVDCGAESPEELAATIGELFISYDLADDDEKVAELCSALWNHMFGATPENAQSKSADDVTGADDEHKSDDQFTPSSKPYGWFNRASPDVEWATCLARRDLPALDPARDFPVRCRPPCDCHRTKRNQLLIRRGKQDAFEHRSECVVVDARVVRVTMSGTLVVTLVSNSQQVELACEHIFAPTTWREICRREEKGDATEEAPRNAVGGGKSILELEDERLAAVRSQREKFSKALTTRKGVFAGTNVLASRIQEAVLGEEEVRRLKAERAAEEKKHLEEVGAWGAKAARKMARKEAAKQARRTKLLERLRKYRRAAADRRYQARKNRILRDVYADLHDYMEGDAKECDGGDASSDDEAIEEEADIPKVLLSTAQRTNKVQATREGLDVSVNDFSLSTLDGSGILLDQAHLRLVAGRVYGLLGRNGVGKTTLMTAIANFELPCLERVADEVCVVSVRQEEDVVSTLPAVQTVLEANEEYDVVMKELKVIEARVAAAQGAPQDGKEQNSNSDDGAGDNKEEEEPVEMLRARLNCVKDKIKGMECWRVERKAADVLKGLGFSEELMNTPTNNLSGGWRMRVKLARALLAEPDLLLLDEPTNHLDFPSVVWLERYLCQVCTGQMTIIVVSHDRYFLNKVCTDSLLIAGQRLQTHRGNVQSFARFVMRQTKAAEKRAEAMGMRLAQMQAFIDKFRYNEKRASLVQSRIKAVERMKAEAREEAVKQGMTAENWDELLAKVQHRLLTSSKAKERRKLAQEREAEKKAQGQGGGSAWGGGSGGGGGDSFSELSWLSKEGQISFQFAEPSYISGGGGVLVTLGDVAFCYTGKYLRKDMEGSKITGKMLFTKVYGQVEMHSRIALLGANGCGKTTLLKLITKEYEPSAGRVITHGAMRIGFFTQHHVDQLNLDKCGLEIIAQQVKGISEHEARSMLGSFGVDANLAVKPVRYLSGGQKSRVAFAVIAARKPHLLILDEPTNHLDLETVQALIGACQTYKGAVLAVSHDQHFLRSVCKEFWSMAGGKLHRYSTFGEARTSCYPQIK